MPHGSAEPPRPDPVARANAVQILGDLVSGLPTWATSEAGAGVLAPRLPAPHGDADGNEKADAQLHRHVPADWAGVSKGRDLFVAGWGSFDIQAAYSSFLAGRHGEGNEAIPSVEVLRSYGYLDKFFRGVAEPMQKERLRHALVNPASALAKYVVRHCAFFSDPAHANCLDEVAQYLDTARGAAAKENPRALLNRLARERAVKTCRLVRFSHIAGLLPSVLFSGGGDQVTSAEDAEFELSVLEDSHTVVRAAQELNNCAADYVADVRRKRCALVVLLRGGKLLAMGEWDLHDRKWSQISEHSDEPIRSEWQRMYDLLEGEWLFPLEARLLLPGDRGDSVTIFNPAASRSLEPLSRQCGESMTLLADWGSSLGDDCHSEAAGALLLWAVEAQESSDTVLSLVGRGGDIDTMTDQGWTALMLATESKRADLAQLFVERRADLNAKGAGGGRTALMMAAAAGELGLARLLVEGRADPDIVARINGKTALVEAVEQRRWATVEYLLGCGAGLDAQRYDGKTALILAAEAGHDETVRRMVEGRADVGLKADGGETVLSKALAAGDLQSVGILADAGVDLEARVCHGRRTALMSAAADGQAEAMALLVRKRALLETTHDSGETALALAVSQRHWSVVRRLAELRANVDARCKDGSIAVTVAAGAGDVKMIDFLADAGADLDAADSAGRTPLASAASRGHINAIRSLAEHRADLNGSGDGGEAALVAAAGAKKWPAVLLLVELAARLEVRDCSNRTALIIAAAEGQAKTLSALLQRRASPESVGAGGETAVVAAARERQWMMVRRLADARADLEATGRGSPKTVTMMAAEVLQWETLEHLAIRRANLNDHGKDGKTVLMYAAECGQERLVQILLKCRAWAEAKDDRGDTALLRACNRQLEGTMRILWEGGAKIDDAVKHSRIPSMGRLLREWSGDDTEEVF